MWRVLGAQIGPLRVGEFLVVHRVSVLGGPLCYVTSVLGGPLC